MQTIKYVTVNELPLNLRPCAKQIADTMRETIYGEPVATLDDLQSYFLDAKDILNWTRDGDEDAEDWNADVQRLAQYFDGDVVFCTLEA